MTESAAYQDRVLHQQQLARSALDGGRGILAIDFDDTLTERNGIDALVCLRARGYGLVVFSANADLEGIESWIMARWPVEAGPPPPCTDRKPQALAFIDDKAVRFSSWEHVLSLFP